MDWKKIKDLCIHTIEECKNRGFTVQETRLFTGSIKQYLDESMSEQSKDQPFEGKLPGSLNQSVVF